MLEEGVDVALRMGALDDSNMTARRISTGRRVFVRTPSYFAKAGLPQTPSDLNRHQAVAYSVRGGGESWLFSRSEGSDSNVTLSGRIGVNAPEGMRTAVAHTGFAVTSEWMFAPEFANGTVQAVLTDWMLPPIDLWAVFPSGCMATTKAGAFVMFVEHLLNERKSSEDLTAQPLRTKAPLPRAAPSQQE